MKKLRKRLLATVFGSAVLVFFLMSVGFYIALVNYNIYQADGLTSTIAINDGEMPNYTEFRRDDYEDRIEYSINIYRINIICRKRNT